MVRTHPFLPDEGDALDVEARPLLTHLFRGMPSCEKVFPVLVLALVVTQPLCRNYWQSQWIR
jgi:hypothetical protein